MQETTPSNDTRNLKKIAFADFYKLGFEIFGAWHIFEFDPFQRPLEENFQGLF